MKTTEDIIKLANYGIHLVTNAGSKSNDDLMQIAYIVNAKGTHLTILQAYKKSTEDLKPICQLLKEHLTLDFTERKVEG